MSQVIDHSAACCSAAVCCKPCYAVGAAWHAAAALRGGQRQSEQARRDRAGCWVEDNVRMPTNALSSHRMTCAATAVQHPLPAP